MFQKDVLNKCKEEGYPITASGLYRAGYKYGFIVKKEGKKRVTLNKTKFLEWLSKAKEQVPKGWMTLNDLHKELNVSLSEVYILIKDPESNVKRIGTGRGIIYADPKQIKKIIEKRKNSRKEDL